MHNKMKTIHHIFSVLASVTLVGGLWLVWAIILDGQVFRRPAEIKAIELEQTEYHPGDTVYAFVSYCKYRALPGSIQWNLVDTYLKPYPEKNTGVATGCRDHIRMEIEKIPLDTYPEMYHFEGIIRYRLNGLNEVDIPLRTGSFKVVK